MKEELIKYVMAEANKCYADDFPIHQIEDWIRQFFDAHMPKCDIKVSMSYTLITDNEIEDEMKKKPDL